MREVSVEQGEFSLPGLLGHSEADKGLVIFAHGSGSSRLSPRNQFVAKELNRHQISTLLFDLLTESESRDRSNVFDIDFLTERLILATRWARSEKSLRDLPFGYFGASTGAAAALVAAAQQGKEIAAVVSRGGRPDLATTWLVDVQAPVLLLVGSHDHAVIALNHEAARHLARCKTIIVPGATHLFEEPGTLEQACVHAIDWFNTYFASNS